MRKYIFILFVLTTALSSCVSYDAEEFTGKTLPRVTGYTTGVTNDWLYINLRTGNIGQWKRRSCRLRIRQLRHLENGGAIANQFAMGGG